MAEVIEKTIKYGKNRYKITSEGNWQILMFGWWPSNTGRPSFRWVPIEAKRVPEEVKKLAK